MDKAAQQVVDLIEHLRLETLREQKTCFYCGGDHRSVECQSLKRKDFHRTLLDITDDADERQTEELGAEDPEVFS